MITTTMNKEMKKSFTFRDDKDEKFRRWSCGEIIFYIQMPSNVSPFQFHNGSDLGVNQGQTVSSTEATSLLSATHLGTHSTHSTHSTHCTHWPPVVRLNTEQAPTFVINNRCATRPSSQSSSHMDKIDGNGDETWNPHRKHGPCFSTPATRAHQ